MTKLRVLDLFSGIGGFSLGLERTGGFETAAFCEIEPYCRKVLAKHWPGVRCYSDVRTLSADRLRADGVIQSVSGELAIHQRRSMADANIGCDLAQEEIRAGRQGTGLFGIDVICGGFPCQDISHAGKGAGIDGERSGLWGEYARLIGEIRPSTVIIENVSALISGRDDYETPTDRCLCGWPYRWRGVSVGAEQVGPMVHSPVRCGDVGEGQTRIGEAASAIRGQSGLAPQGDGQVGSSAEMGDWRQSMPGDAGGRPAVPGAEERAGDVVAVADERGRRNHQSPGFGIEPEGAERDAGGGLVCPACSRPVANAATRSGVGTWMGRILFDLAALGYDAEWHCIPAAAVGAPHRRDRVWIVADAECRRWDRGRVEPAASSPGVAAANGGAMADAESGRCGEGREGRLVGVGKGLREQALADTDGRSLFGAAIAWPERHPWQFEPDVGRVAHGVPMRVDRLRALGNAVVPQIPELIGRAILESREVSA